nr:hypothetical protein [Tanacetum cinerariifolium]
MYKALVDAYEADKTILESYGGSVILKRRREDDDDQEGPSAGSDRGSKRQREGREHASASTPSEQATESAGRSTTGTQSRQLSAIEAYDADKTILDSYGESTILKRRHEDDDNQEGPSVRSDRGSKRQREGREHASAITPSETATGSVGRSTTGTQSRQLSATDLTEMELKKILIEKMEGNKHRHSEEKTWDDDDQEGPSAGSDRGSKRQREGGEHESPSTPSEPATRSASRSTIGTQSRQMSASEYAFAEEPVQTTCQMDEPPHPVFETGVEDQPIVQTSQYPEWFSQPRKPLTPDRDWNKTLPTIQGSAQTWISELAKQADSCSSFNELLDTLIDFSNFIMNWLGVDTLTLELLAGPTYELMRGSCNILTELEYHLEEVYKATTDQLDW